MEGAFEHRELPEDAANQTPESVSYGFAAASDFIASYGWYILFGVIGLVYINSWLDTRLQGWKKQRRQDAEYNRYDAEEVLKRQEAIDRARERLQAQYDSEAKEYEEKKKEREAQKRQDEIEDWDRHQQGLGYKSKKKAPEGATAVPQPNKSSSDKPKKSLRGDNYNPLWGGQGSGFRPARRGFSGGG